MKHRRYQSIVAMCLTFLMLLSALLVVSPPAAGAVWRQESDTDFGAGSFLNTEIVGAGASATVQLTKDLLNWVPMSPPGAPSPRQGHAMAFDSLGGVTVLFGGYNGTDYFDDTWEYDYSTDSWTPIPTPTRPSPREGAAMAYDSMNQVVVLFGGFNVSGTLSDTWEYDVNTNTWTEIFPPSWPGTMLGHGLVYDSVSYRSVLVGRDDKTGIFETWAYRADTNTWWQRNPTNNPPARNRFALAFHGGIGRTVLFGGALGMTGYNDTWEYNYSADQWDNTLNIGPEILIESAMVYFATNNSIFLYGGLNSTGSYPPGTWRYYYDMGSPAWTFLPLPADPMGRAYHSMAYDSANDVAIFFGGFSGIMYWSDTWSLGFFYQTYGRFLSSVFDSQDTETVWGSMWWNDTPAAQPPNTILKFHICTYNYTGDLCNLVGPDGTFFTYYEIGMGEAIYVGQRGRYLQYEATLESSDVALTSVFDDIDITYNVIPAPPIIIKTDPYSGEPAVERTRDITIWFNEPMDTATVNVAINPSLTVTPNWYNVDTKLVLTHVQLLAEAQLYMVTVTGKDLDGNDLQAGPVANPFFFVTGTDDPEIVATDPAHMEENVPITKIITVDFSETMNASSVNWAIVPSVTLSGSWNGDNTTLSLSHAVDFAMCTDYTVTITGEDLLGNPLVPGPVPNPWDFKTVCPYPFITFTDPLDGAIGVAIDYAINVTFNEEMNPATLAWDISPSITLTEAWEPGNESVIFTHGVDFVDCQTYTMNITYAEDIGGDPLGPGLVPNPWIFTAACANPQIATTDPYDGEAGVAVDRDIVVGFSKTMDTTSVKWEIVPSIGFSSSWLLDQVLTLSHAAPFGECTQYQMTITWANDTLGNPLVPGPVPNPWTFDTVCDNPVVVDTDPYDGESDVLLNADIVVTFSEEIIPASLNWTIGPNPGMWTRIWESGNTVLRLQHANPFNDSTLYTVRIDTAKDLDGNDLVAGPVPNPWQFTTIIVGPNPQIVETVPANGSTSIPVDQVLIVNFSEPMDTGTVTVGIAPLVTLSPAWSNGDQTLTLTHAVDFAENTVYTVTVAGKDLDGNDLVPGPVPNPFVFTTIFVSPQIGSTVPGDGDIGVALDAVIQVSFSESMNVSSVGWSIAPVVPLSDSWGVLNTTLWLDPTINYTDCTPYTVTIWGSDPDGNPLIAGPVPNPWTFTTTCVNPFITTTNPFDGELAVPIWRNITIDFSEAIDVATFQWNITPDEGLIWTETWSPGNMSVELRHSFPFTLAMTYTVTVIRANDTDGYTLIAGPAANPWTFTIFTPTPPFIQFTDPFDGAFPVGLTDNIRIKFNEPMDTASVTWTISPGITGISESWEEMDSLLNISHDPFTALTDYQAEVLTGKDLEGSDLIPGPVPNPWNFTTGMVANPFIVGTIPADLDTGVALDANITIVFSEEIDTATFQWSINPNPTGWTPNWMAGNTIVNLTHTNPYDPLTDYVVEVTAADDLDGNALIGGPVPNPWNFTTGVAEYPTVLSIDPFDGQIDVDLTAEIIVTFSEPMNTATVTWTIIPNPGGWLPDQWTGGDTILTLNHTNLFAECQSHQFMITNGQDLDGNDLVPLPFTSTFTTKCFNPYIVSTDPFDAETNVEVTRSITVVFNEPMNAATVTWNIMPAIVLASSWPDSMTLVLSHPVDFDMCQRYDVNITGGEDLDGLPLIAGPVPNPWYFITECVLAAPSGLEVVRAFPNDVELTFNTSVGATSYHVYESSDRFAIFPGGWSVTDCIAPPCTMAGHLSDGLAHYYILRAFDSGMGVESGNSTMGVKIQKDFSYNPGATNVYWMSLPYNSIYTKASDIANELTEGNIRVVGKWDIAAQKTRLYYYLRGRWRGNDFDINSGDGIYVSTISSFSWYITGSDRNTTLSFTYSPSFRATNEHWISIPYTGTYGMASDIVTDIEGGTGPNTNTKIIEVGLWDPSTQGVVTYTYTPTGWTGDFAISPGDGIYLKVVTSFNWQPKLITPEVP